jgi:dienelactone hydrolase
VPAEPALAPSPQLVLQGLPPIPISLAQSVARYGEFRGHSFVAWHPQRREMVVSHRPPSAPRAQLFRVGSPMAPPEVLTDEPDRIGRARFEPAQGRYLVYTTLGDDQLHRLDLDARGVPRAAPVALADPARRHTLGPFLNRRAQFLSASVPAQGAAASTRIDLVDPQRPGARTVATLEGSGWFVESVSADDRQALLGRRLSPTQAEVWRLDLASGRATRVLPEARPPAGLPAEALHLPVAFSADGRQVFALSNRAGEYMELVRVDLTGAQLVRVSAHVPWDVGPAALSPDGRVLAARVNADGRDELRLFDAVTLRERSTPPVPEGEIVGLAFDDTRGELALTINNAQGPNLLFSVYPGAGRGDAWTRPHAPARLDAAAFRPAESVRWPSFDGQEIHALLHRPPARFEGRRPVLVLLHGGPEAQARAGYMGRFNHFLHEQGVALLEPNVRGSTGYGKAFARLDDGARRGDAVKDLGAMLEWIATEPGLDAERVVLMGGGWGGALALMAAAQYGERLAGAIGIAAPVDLPHFVATAPQGYAAQRRAEFGDAQDAAAREVLAKLSPLALAPGIRVPLLLVHGRRDESVPAAAVDALAARVRANGATVWLLRGENEGHGFALPEHADYQFHATVRFMQAVVRGELRRPAP